MWKCKKCKEEIEDQFDVCWNCGSDRMGSIALDKEAQTTLKEIKTDIELEKSRSKYPTLRTIAGFYTLLAWIVGVVAVIIAIYSFIQGEGLIFAISILVVGALIVLSALAASESIMVVIDIEYNTRQKSKTK